MPSRANFKKKLAIFFCFVYPNSKFVYMIKGQKEVFSKITIAADKYTEIGLHKHLTRYSKLYLER